MESKLSIQFSDFSNEKSNATFNVAQMTAANFDAQNTLMDALVTAVGDLTEGLQVKDTRTASVVGSGQGSATDPTAQRENKWLVTYSDDVTLKHYQLEIPCPFLSLAHILPGVGGNADLSDADWVAFIAAFDAVVVSPADNASSFVSARHVGRNN